MTEQELNEFYASLTYDEYHSAIAELRNQVKHYKKLAASAENDADARSWLTKMESVKKRVEKLRGCIFSTVNQQADLVAGVAGLQSGALASLRGKDQANVPGILNEVVADLQSVLQAVSDGTAGNIPATVEDLVKLVLHVLTTFVLPKIEPEQIANVLGITASLDNQEAGLPKVGASNG